MWARSSRLRASIGIVTSEEDWVKKFALKEVNPSLLLGSDICIVGSSPRIVGKGLGAEIDCHHEVIRFNYAITRGFEADAGSRTTLRFIGQRVHIAGTIFDQFNAVLPSADGALLTKHKNIEALSTIVPDRELYIWSGFEKHRRFFKTFVTTVLGVQAFDGPVNFRSGVMIALLLLISSDFDCKITMYGFDSLQGREIGGGHYFGTHSTKGIGKFHTDLSIEFDVIDRLISQGYVKYV